MAALVASSILLSSCGVRTDESSGSSQPIYNANGDLIAGGDGTLPLLGAASPEDVLTLRVISDVNSIATGGTDIATITALVTDANNNALAQRQVTFSSSGGVLQNISTATDINGEASATLKLPQDFKNQDIIVTVSAEEFESTVKVTASGSTLEITGPDNLVTGDTAQLIVRLTAGNGEPIANQAVGVTSVAGNSISPVELITDADGRVEVSVGSENSSDTIRISALDGTVSESHSFDVVEDLLSFTNASEGSELVVGSERVVITNWTSQGQPVVGRALRFSVTAGRIAAPATVVTDAQGNASVRVSSNSAGPAKITVEAAETGAPKTDVDVEFVATLPNMIRIDASVSRVGIHDSSTITARVTDSLGNPVKNKEVSFAGADLKGGQINPASAVTNSAGIATVTFTAGSNPTELDEIEIESSVKDTDIKDSLVLTVFKRALNITFGSSNNVVIKPLGTQYAMPFVVQVSDGAATPLENASVSISVRPLSFGKGLFELVDASGLTQREALAAEKDFSAHRWQIVDNFITCPAEDLDGDRILDIDGAVSEDTNGNGSLDPQDPASVTAIDGGYATLSGGSLTTDKNGSGFFELLYPASNAAWAYVEVTARAEALGEEAIETYETILSMPASEINNTDALPANVISPYGTDLRAAILRQVVLNNRVMNVYRGCESAY